MPKGQFDAVTLTSASTLNATGPFEFAPGEENVTTVLIIDVVLIQGKAFAHGTSTTKGAGTNWIANADVVEGEFKPGEPAQGFGVAVLVQSGDPPLYQTVAWSETVKVNP
jgi:hypothetical protein